MVIVAEFCIFNLGNVNMKLHIFFKSWSRILCSVSPIKSCIEYLAAFNALFIKPYYIHDTGSRLQASLPSWCSKRLVRHSKIHIYHYYTSFFFNFTHHILILVSYFLFFNSFSCIYFCSFLVDRDEKLIELTSIFLSLVISHKNFASRSENNFHLVLSHFLQQNFVTSDFCRTLNSIILILIIATVPT